MVTIEPRKVSPPLTFWIFLRDVGLALVLWLLLTTAIGQARMVPSASMAPTIDVGDRVWADKIGLWFSEIRRGDVVIFDPPFESESPYIKRVIGLPGEKVAVHSGKVWVDGTPLAEPYLVDKPWYQYGPVSIPPGYYLVLGDNRNDSYDSHSWGLLAEHRIQARALFRLWPPARVGEIE